MIIRFHIALVSADTGFNGFLLSVTILFLVLLIIFRR